MPPVLQNPCLAFAEALRRTFCRTSKKYASREPASQNRVLPTYFAGPLTKEKRAERMLGIQRAVALLFPLLFASRVPPIYYLVPSSHQTWSPDNVESKPQKCLALLSSVSTS